MTATVFGNVAAMQCARDGTMLVAFTDGRFASAAQGQHSFGPTSAIATSTHFPQSSHLLLETLRGDRILVELPIQNDLSPLRGRPVVYLDQNHWSTLAHAIHQPKRVHNGDELAAARHVIGLALSFQVVLPLSSAHMSETCKQVDSEERYLRALTLARLSAGWQLRDPLDLRRLELRQSLSTRYHDRQLALPAAVTLEPNAVHASRGMSLADVATDLPEEARWAVHAIRCIGGIMDTMLDAEHLPVEPAHGWADELQCYAQLLATNPIGREMKRRRTHAKFIADIVLELAEEARRVGLGPGHVTDWAMNHSEEDLRLMPALGLYREVLHEKLSCPTLRWKPNDLVDMMYLTAGGGYCDYVVAEAAHASHMRNGLRRLGRATQVHNDLRTLVGAL